jgi:uncharacterized DUF497 family protein
MYYNFDWDKKKAKSNLQKHDVSFERAATIFLDPQMLALYDDEHSDDEERWITVGIDNIGILLAVCHTFRMESDMAALIRIFSARKATTTEAVQYREL